MRRENAYILELCRFQDADPERLRDWMAQGLDYGCARPCPKPRYTMCTA